MFIQNLLMIKLRDFMKKIAIIGVVFATFSVTGCAINLPFNNRLNYSSISQLSTLPKLNDKIVIKWNPETFPKRIDIQGADGFVGGGTRTRVPTGIALSNRIEEAIAQYVTISSDGKPLMITVENARSGFEYSAGIFNITPAVDVANVTLTATFNYEGKSWSNTYTSKLKDPKIGGSSQTGLLESTWDDIAIQVAKDVSKHLN